MCAQVNWVAGPSFYLVGEVERVASGTLDHGLTFEDAVVIGSDLEQEWTSESKEREFGEGRLQSVRAGYLLSPVGADLGGGPVLHALDEDALLHSSVSPGVRRLAYLQALFRALYLGAVILQSTLTVNLVALVGVLDHVPVG